MEFYQKEIEKIDKSKGIYTEKDPHIKFPKYISKLENNSYLITSEIMNWSNLAIMVDRNFFLKVIIEEAEITDSNKKINV